MAYARARLGRFLLAILGILFVAIARDAQAACTSDADCGGVYHGTCVLGNCVSSCEGGCGQYGSCFVCEDGGCIYNCNDGDCCILGEGNPGGPAWGRCGQACVPETCPDGSTQPCT